MSFESPVPAQTDAVTFLTECGDSMERLYVCGHSKGGNLAMYAAACCPPDVQRKLIKVYSFDGPGLDDYTCDSAGYAAIADRIASYVPESSIVGMLMDYHDNYTIVDSDGVSIQQHNAFLWHIVGNHFVVKPELTRSGRYTDRTLHDFMTSCTPEERRVLVNTLYDIIAATGAQKLRDIPGGIARNMGAVLTALKQVPPQSYQVLSHVFKVLAEAGGSNLSLLWKNQTESSSHQARDISK